MVKTKKKQSLNKKPIIAIVVSIIIAAAVGSVIAFRSDITNFINGLKVGDGKASYTENFISPDNWSPCTTTPKTVTATNTDSNPIIVRVSYEDYWKNQYGGSLPLEQDGNRITTINLDNQEDWTLDESDGWYYYKEPLQPGQSTSSFMASVTFNCSFNLGNNTLNVCDDQGHCTTPANPYGKAKYHVAVTIQTTRDGGTWPAIDPCKSRILYNEIACHTNGPDTGVNFRTASTTSNNNGNGINTRTPYAEDEYPVYYYRGELSNNYVVWANYCWQILRTTGTGGVKLIYSGAVVDNNGSQICDGSGKGRYIGDQSSSHFTYSTGMSTSSPIQAYYMYGGGTYHWGGTKAERVGHTASYGHDENDDFSRGHLGSGIMRSQGRYTAIGDVIYPLIGNSFRPTEITPELLAGHRYLCDDPYEFEGAYCARGAILLYENQIFRLLSPELSIADAMENLQKNTYNSDIKTKIDNWYAANLTAYTSQLEDTSFCADRRYTGYLANDSYVDSLSQTQTLYSGRSNLTDPRVECPRKHDSFTVNESATGNGALTYPVALPTLSEAVMAGAVYGYIYQDYNWLTNMKDGTYIGGAWTMTPNAVYGAGRNASLFVIGPDSRSVYVDSDATGSARIRPVVSLKPGTKFWTGTGAVSAPYIIE